ncbi:MAG: hypothetical protein QM791_09965 [Ferruginibacter sp.]
MKLIPVFLLILFASCSDSFINHKLKYEKLGDCNRAKEPVKMLSNINGERYELVSCIDDDFNGSNYTVERKGDTIVVDFPKRNAAKAAFKLTLDIDAKPVYKYILLDGEAIPITQLY